jgi:hypothetical protein
VRTVSVKCMIKGDSLLFLLSFVFALLAGEVDLLVFPFHCLCCKLLVSMLTSCSFFNKFGNFLLDICHAFYLLSLHFSFPATLFVFFFQPVHFNLSLWKKLCTANHITFFMQNLLIVSNYVEEEIQ